MNKTYITNSQIEEVKRLYERACKLQSSAPYGNYDATEIQAIMSVCRILKIKLD